MLGIALPGKLPSDDAFTLPDVPGVAVEFHPVTDAEKCARCWMILPDVGTHAEHPDLCGRCVDAVEALG